MAIKVDCTFHYFSIKYPYLKVALVKFRDIVDYLTASCFVGLNWDKHAGNYAASLRVVFTLNRWIAVIKAKNSGPEEAGKVGPVHFKCFFILYSLSLCLMFMFYFQVLDNKFVNVRSKS